jgi:hypothetical protein
MPKFQIQRVSTFEIIIQAPDEASALKAANDIDADRWCWEGDEDESLGECGDQVEVDYVVPDHNHGPDNPPTPCETCDGPDCWGAC